MFARAVVIKVQPGCDVEVTRTFKQEVITLFRKERDFRGLVALTVPDGTGALSFSLRDQEESAPAFQVGADAGQLGPRVPPDAVLRKFISL